MNKLQFFGAATLFTLAGCASAVKAEKVQQPVAPVPLSQAASPKPEIGLNIYQQVCQALLDSLDSDMEGGAPIDLKISESINSARLGITVRRTDITENNEHLGAAAVECKYTNISLSDLLAHKHELGSESDLKIVEGRFAATNGGEKDPRLKQPLVFSADPRAGVIAVDSDESGYKSQIFCGRTDASNELTTRFEDLARKVLGFLTGDLNRKRPKVPDGYYDDDR